MGYNKKILSKAVSELDKAKAPPKPRDIITDARGQWEHPGQPTRIPGNNITMEGVPYPVYGIDNTGFAQMMYPGQNYQFQGDYVDEYPLTQAKKGGEKKYSRSLSATNKLFKKNPLVKGKKKKNKKTFDPNAKYYQDGGELPEDYQTFLDYSTTAPENRRPDENYVYGNPNDYDHYGMWEALGKPKDFDEALKMNPDWEPDPYDNMYHGFSVNPYTGVFLKSGKPGLTPGDTTWMEIAGHYLSPRAMMDTPVYDPEIQRFRYVPNDKSTEMELTPEEIEEYKKGGYIVEYLDDPSVFELTQAQTGGQAPEKEQTLSEVTVYGDEDKKKLQGNLMDKLQQVKGAYQDWREDAGLRRTRLRNEGASTIEGLKREIAEYKKQLDEEKKMYDKAGKALNVLKKQRPDEWKNAKIGDVLSTKGIEALRSLYSENKISDQTFRDFYNNFGSEYDPNVAKGKGPDRAYSAKEAEKDWMYDAPGFANMVNKFAMAAPLVGGLAALAPSVVETYGTLQASPFMQALGPAYRAPIAGIPGATAANFVRSIFLGETLSRIGDPIKSLKAAYSGEIDASQAALDVTEYATEMAMMGLPMMSIRNAATDLVKVADAPISKLIAPAGKWLQKNVPLTGKITSELEKIGELAPTITPIKLPNKIKPFVPSLNVPSLKDLSTADILRTETVLSTLKNAPENYTAVQKNIDLAIDPNASSADRLRALASAGNTSAANLLSMTPLFRKTAPLYNSRLAHALFLANNAIADDWRHSKTPLNISRLLTRQEGGSTSYVTELSNKKIKELERQGYKVEYLD